MNVLSKFSKSSEDVVSTLTAEFGTENDYEESIDNYLDSAEQQFGQLPETPPPKDTPSPIPTVSSSGFPYNSRLKFGQLPETPPPKDTPSPIPTVSSSGFPYNSRRKFGQLSETARVLDQRVACLPRFFRYGYFPIDKLLSSEPCKPEKSCQSERIKSFLNWAFDKVVSSYQLAAAGFYYPGINDIVRCFHCDGAIHNWQFGDDPFTLHAKCFPNCGFILKTKGREFVESQSQSFFC
ncbi:uncharacterized protein LOC128397738 [Panonychus citri]|uniref:uncharacterized protein LOC128397738 n=1 Tax=Panonychus citri TaxID=50023 RepID=UPI002307E107|nr:uncharacterized protein LOC128397738 [Panonychus citri]